MKAGTHFSETVTDHELDQWERDYDKAKAEYCARKEAGTYTDDRTPAQREAYDQGQDDYGTDDVDDLRAMRCEFYAAGVRTAHYSTAEQG